jgi:hypothetical protein
VSTSFVAVGTPVTVRSSTAVANAAEDGELAMTIRCGSRFVALDRRSAALWARAARPIDRERLAVDEEQRAALAELIDTGLVVPFADDVGQATAEVLELVPVPSSIGLGPTIDDPIRFVIADRAGVELIRVAGPDYVIWSHLDGRTSIRSVLSLSGPELACDPAELGPRVPALFAALVACGAVAMDAGKG